MGIYFSYCNVWGYLPFGVVADDDDDEPENQAVMRMWRKDGVAGVCGFGGGDGDSDDGDSSTTGQQWSWIMNKTNNRDDDYNDDDDDDSSALSQHNYRDWKKIMVMIGTEDVFRSHNIQIMNIQPLFWGSLSEF